MNARGLVEGFRYDGGNAEEERDGVWKRKGTNKSREVGIWRFNPVGRK